MVVRFMESTRDNPSFDEIVDFLKNKIDSHYESSSTPLYLSSLGYFIHSHIGVHLQRQFKIGLKNIIYNYLPEDYVLVQHPTIPQKIAVAKDHNQETVKQQVGASPNPDFPALTSSSASSHPTNAVALAFQVLPEAGSEVYLKTEPPIFYQVSQVAPAPPFVIIDRDLSLQKEKPKYWSQLPEDEKNKIKDYIDIWCQRHNIHPDNLYIRKMRRTDKSKGSAESAVNALERLINAQDESLRSRMLIPADIAELLSRQK